jgi:hypothetical protein
LCGPLVPLANAILLRLLSHESSPFPPAGYSKKSRLPKPNFKAKLYYLYHMDVFWFKFE